MNLLPLMVIRLFGVVALCLAATAAWVVVDAHSAIERETVASADRVGKHLSAIYWQEQLWRGRGRSGLNTAAPEWQSFATLNLISPGVCVTFALPDDAPRTLCSQTAALGRPAPGWFVAAYESLFAADAVVRRPLFERDASFGYALHAPDRDAAIRQAWHLVSLVVLIAAGLAAGIAVLGAVMIRSTLKPTRAIVEGLRQLERGHLDARLPSFRIGDFARIGSAVNALAGRLAATQAERAALTTRLLEVQETERRALARDLHDEFGQCLTATAALAASIEAGAPEGRDDIADEARAIGRVQERMMKTLRSALVRLRTQDIEEIGLEASLRQLVSEHNVQTSGRGAGRSVFHLDVNGEIATLPRAIAIDVYRIAQECLTNAARHGTPSDVRLSVARAAEGGSTVAVTVEDDGGGDASQLRREGRHGIAGMHERIAALGGSLAIERARRGVRVAAVIPLGSPAVAGAAA